MLEIIYQDESFIAVDKPTRLLSVPGKGPDKQDCCYRRVRKEFPDALVVHRLDMDTSGLLLFARTPETQRDLSAQFENRSIEKTYTAVVEGIINEDAGIIDFPIRRDMKQSLPPKHLVDCVRGKKALTEWKVLERYEETTRVALFPKTGRSHQLRLHMQSIGHPIAGDPIYGLPTERLMLHADSLAFLHPVTGEAVRLVSPVPF